MKLSSLDVGVDTDARLLHDVQKLIVGVIGDVKLVRYCLPRRAAAALPTAKGRGAGTCVAELHGRRRARSLLGRLPFTSVLCAWWQHMCIKVEDEQRVVYALLDSYDDAQEVAGALNQRRFRPHLLMSAEVRSSDVHHCL